MFMEYRLPIVRREIADVLCRDLYQRAAEGTRIDLSTEICERVARENPILYKELCNFTDNKAEIACGCFVYELLRREGETQFLERDSPQR